MSTLEGVDVSAYQGTPQWGEIRGAGKHFAFIKATEGRFEQDPKFAYNWRNARMAGLVIGAYHYAHPEPDGSVQADYLHAYVRNNGRFRPGDAVILDLEESDGRSPTEVVAFAEQFVARARVQIAKQVILYTYPAYWVDVLGNPTSSVLATCPLWLADYGPSVPALRNWPHGLSFWQYSETGHCPGVAGEVDLDRFYGNELALKRVLQWPPEG